MSISTKRKSLTQNKNILNNNNFDIKKAVPILEKEHWQVFY
jgi:hypothetical protein